MSIFKKRNKFSIALILIANLLLLASCDSVYVVRGKASELVQKDRSDQLHTGYLNDVAMHVLTIGRDGNVSSVVGHLYSTDRDGNYRISFIGPPFGLGSDVYLEFTKPGYVRKRIFIVEDNKDPDASVIRCPE